MEFGLSLDKTAIANWRTDYFRRLATLFTWRLCSFYWAALAKSTIIIDFMVWLENLIENRLAKFPTHISFAIDCVLYKLHKYTHTYWQASLAPLNMPVDRHGTFIPVYEFSHSRALRTK